jgi:uncharacterized membrane protein YciS (DUF1049 family)
MKILKWIVSFAIAFLVAWILIFTFIQEPFKVPASARILTYWTPAIPIYAYVAGAFGLGLLLGLFAAFYYYVVLQSKVHKSSRELHALEEKLADAHRSLEQCELSHKPVEFENHQEVAELSPDRDDDPMEEIGSTGEHP